MIFVRLKDGILSMLLALKGAVVGWDAVSATTETMAPRRVGSLLESVDDVMKNPTLLQG